jgi:hypothetical protein
MIAASGARGHRLSVPSNLLPNGRTLDVRLEQLVSIPLQ